MLTWQDVLNDLRADMQDPNESRISDDTALLYLQFALRDYSRWNPRPAFASLDLDEEGKAPLPDDFLRVREVRDSASQNIILPLSGYSNPPTAELSSSYYRWWIDGSELRLNTWNDLDDGVDLYYNAYHTAPPTATSFDFTMTFPDADEEAILLYIRYKAAGSSRTKTSYLDRYKGRRTAGNTRLDNPLGPESESLYEGYLDIIHQRYGNRSVVRMTRRR